MEEAKPGEGHRPGKRLGYGLQIAGCAWIGFMAWTSYRTTYWTTFEKNYFFVLWSWPSIWLIWLGRKRLQPPAQVEIAKPSENTEADGQEKEGFPWGSFLLLAVLAAGSLVFYGFVVLLVYGVAVIVFRMAFGIDLPNPFNWF